MRFALLIAKAVILCLLFVSASTAQDSVAPSLSLSDLDALMEEDERGLPALEGESLIDLVALIAFLALAVISFLKKNVALKYATMVAAIGYMGFTKGNLVSLVHIFNLIEWSFPIFEHNISWYVLMIFTVLSTLLWGRLYCGRICAFGALTQLMDKIIPARFRYELPPSVENKAKYLKYFILMFVVSYFFITKDNFVYKYVEPFWMFTLSGTTVTWVLLALLLLVTVFIRNFYCRYLCAVGAGLGVISTVTLLGIKRWKQCDTCKLCEKACEWGAIKGPRIDMKECVRCDDCEILYHDRSRCVHWLMIKKWKRRQNVEQQG